MKVIYAAPMAAGRWVQRCRGLQDVRRKKPVIEPRQNKAALLRRQNGEKEPPSARDSARCRSVSPERREEPLGAATSKAFHEAV